MYNNNILFWLLLRRLQVQRVCPGPYLAAPLENLLNAVLQQGAGPRCVFDKAFLFDTPTKLVIASDSNPAQEGTYQVRVVCAISGAYARAVTVCN